MKRILTTALWLSLLAVAPAMAATDNARGITVSGEAEVQVTPDEVVMTLGVETFDKDLRQVRRLNDQRIKDVLAAVTAAGVANKDVRTDYLNLQPEYEDRDANHRRVLRGYVQRTTMVITLRDVSKFEALLTGTLRAGVEYIHGIDFRTSEMRKYRDEARVLAIKAAREKAIALAAVLDQQIGRPTSITEGGGGWFSNYGGGWGSGHQGMSQNVMQSSAGGQEGGQDRTLAPGNVSVRANVTVVFELK
jgi:uncharacterized protein YggE